MAGFYNWVGVYCAVRTGVFKKSGHVSSLRVRHTHKTELFISLIHIAGVIKIGLIKTGKKFSKCYCLMYRKWNVQVYLIAPFLCPPWQVPLCKFCVVWLSVAARLRTFTAVSVWHNAIPRPALGIGRILTLALLIFNCS